MCHIKFNNEPQTTKCLPPAAFYHHPIGKKIVEKPLIIIARSPLDSHEGKLSGFYYKVSINPHYMGDVEESVVDFLKKEGFGPLEEEFTVGQKVMLQNFTLGEYIPKIEEVDSNNATGKPT